MKFRPAAVVVAILAFPIAAQARSTANDKAETASDTAPASTLTVSGPASIASDYRFRGVSQSDQEMAVQGGITIAHESGLYVGTWASNLAGWGTFGGANMELDLIGGYKAKIAATATLTAGAAYAPKQQAIGKWYNTGTDAANGVYNKPSDRDDKLYLWDDGALALADTPITAKAHVGRSWGRNGLGPNATAVAPTGAYWNWSRCADATCKNLTFHVSYVDTDISNREASYLRPQFSKGQDGTGNIAGGTVVAPLTAAF